MLRRSIKKITDTLRTSFGFRLFIVSVAVISGVLFLFTALTIFIEERLVKEELMRKGSTLVDILESGSRAGIFSEDSASLREAAAVVLEQENVRHVSIYDAKGKMLYFSYGSAFKGKGKDGPPLLPEGFLSFKVAGGGHQAFERDDHFEFLKPVTIRAYTEQVEGLFFNDTDHEMKDQLIGYVRVALDRGPLERTARDIVTRNGVIAVFMIFFCTIIFIQIVHKVTTPLVRLTEGVKHLAKGERVEHIPAETDDEIGRLSKAFNDMADDLRNREEENRILQEKLYQAKKMEAIGTLARGLAHDFNNIIGAVKGNMYMLKKKMDEDHPLHAFVSNMENPLQKAGDLIESLMTFSKGKVVQLVPVDVNRIIMQMGGTIRSLLGDGIEYAECISKGAVNIMADPMQIEQVIINLVSNARDAMAGKGIFSIESKVISMGPVSWAEEIDRKTERYGIIIFSDTGSGIKNEDRERIFEPFFTTKDVGEGTGLGLSIIHSIMEAHNGFIDYESAEGKGTKFSLYFPIREGEGKDPLST